MPDKTETRPKREKKRRTGGGHKSLGVFENAGIGIVYTDENGTVTAANAAFREMTGYKDKEIAGKPLADLFEPKERPQAFKLLEEVRKKPLKNLPAEIKIIPKKGDELYFLACPAIIKGNGKKGQWAFFLMDITGLKKREGKLSAALHEKEVLLKEIHHRVKNNMQIISSLLRLQAGAVQDERLSEVLQASQSRIRSISLIHEKLYQSRDLASVDFADYINVIAGQLFHLTGADASAIRLEVQAADVRLEAKRAIPCGLIINELVLNALKYAFPQGKPGTIRIEMRPQAGGRYALVVSDDGVGLPDRIDIQKAEKLGFQIVKDLVKQLDGTIEIDRRAGITFKITF